MFLPHQVAYGQLARSHASHRHWHLRLETKTSSQFVLLRSGLSARALLVFQQTTCCPGSSLSSLVGAASTSMNVMQQHGAIRKHKNHELYSCGRDFYFYEPQERYAEAMGGSSSAARSASFQEARQHFKLGSTNITSGYLA